MMAFWWIVGVASAVSLAISIPVAYHEIKGTFKELMNARKGPKIQA